MMNNATQLPTITQLVNSAVAVLQEHSDETINTSEKNGVFTIWADDDSFPKCVINTGTPGSETWEGDHEVLEAFRAVESAGCRIEMKGREIGDETAYAGSPTLDFKLIITVL